MHQVSCTRAVFIVWAALVAAACSSPAAVGSAADVNDVDDLSADGATASGDVAAGDVAADTSATDSAPIDTPLLAVDAKAIALLLQARAGAATAGEASWPGPVAIWPDYKLQSVPTLLVLLDGKLKPLRAYVVGFAAVPAGAEPVAAAEFAGKVFRYDAATSSIGAAEEIIVDHDVAGTSALVVTYAPSRDTEPDRWVRRLGEGYMLRLRDIEARWAAVQACGQVRYPRDREAIALLFLECAVLTEAYTASDAAVATTMLQEWAAVRAAAIDEAAAVGARIRHYDNLFGSSLFTSGRLVVATELRDRPWLNADYLARLAAPVSVDVALFDDEMSDNGALGAASMEIASRIGWDIEPPLRNAQIIFALIGEKLGPPTAAQVESAKARHDWQAFLARADAIMALPIDD